MALSQHDLLRLLESLRTADGIELTSPFRLGVAAVAVPVKPNETNVML
jgi:hypothetical protein